VHPKLPDSSQRCNVFMPHPSSNAFAFMTKPDPKAKTCWPQHTSLHRNTTASDAITRLWQGDPARQSASVRERQVDVMNLHHRQLIKAALIGLEAIGRTEAHSEIAMKYQPKRFPTVVAPHRFRMR